MKIKLINIKNKINPLLGICFKPGGYDKELVENINAGEEVEVKFIPLSAKELVKEVKVKPKGDK